MTEPDKPATAEVHTISVFLDRSTQATNLLAAIKQPYTSDSGNPVLLTNSPRQSLIQLPTLMQEQGLTYSGTLISLASDGSQITVGTSTEAVALSPSAARHDGMIPVPQPYQAISTDSSTSQPVDSLTLKLAISLTKTGISTHVAASEALVTAGVSNTVIAQPFGTLQSSGIPSEGQSALAEQSFTPSHPLAASGNVSVSGTVVSLGPGLPSIVMGTQVQATGSHGTGSPSYGLFNSTSPLAFQGYATRAHVTWGGFVIIAFVGLISIYLV